VKLDLSKTLGLDKLSEALPVPREAIEKALNEGQIPSYDICGVKLVTEEDLDSYIEGSYSKKNPKDLQEAMDEVSAAFERKEKNMSWEIPGDVVKTTIQTAFAQHGDEMAKTFAFKVEELSKTRNKEIEKLNKRVSEERAKAVKAEVACEASQKSLEAISKAKNEALDKVKALEEENKALSFQLSQKKEVVIKDESLLAECIAKDEEIAKLKEQVRLLTERKDNQNVKACDGLFSTTEDEFFAGEHKALLLSLAKKELDQLESNTDRTRLKVLLQDILEHNEMPDGYEEFLGKIDALSDSDNKALGKGLKGLGFEEVSQNGHKKLVFRNDDRFWLTLCVSPGDWRSLKEAKATVKRTLTF
jgi:hypothetical protein